MASNNDLERAALLTASADPNENNLSNSDLRQVVTGRQNRAVATASLSTNDVELAFLRAASVDPNKDSRSLVDLRRAAWGG
jgi:hypothetical protein